MSSFPPEQEFEALRGFARTGANEAAQALAEMTGLTVRLGEPRLGTVPLHAAASLVGEERVNVVALLLRIGEGHRAAVMISLAPATARRLLARLIPGRRSRVADLAEIERSGLMELGNVVGAAYANALSAMLSRAVLNATPALAVDMAGAVVGEFLADISNEESSVLVIESPLEITSAARTDPRDRILLAPEQAWLNELARSRGAASEPDGRAEI